MLRIILLFFLIFNLQANTLTKKQLNKLTSSVTTIENHTFKIEEYNFITFSKKVFFAGEDYNKITIKTLSTMKEGTLHKELFIALSASLFDQLINMIFLTDNYLDKIKATGILIDKPLFTNLEIQLNFVNNGISTTIKTKESINKKFIPYSALFNFEINQ